MGTETILSKDETMIVRKSDPQVEEKKYRLSSSAIPAVFLEPAFSQMLDGGYKKIILDIIEADGTIVPTIISRIKPKDIAAAGEETAYVLKLEFLDGRDFSELVYLDDQKQISKRLLHRKDIFILERTDAESILRQFPERADYILEKNKMLKQNQPRIKIR